MNDKPYIVVAYYTTGTLYEARAKILVKSLERYEVPHHIQAIDDLGSWQLNTSYKPTFLIEKQKQFSPKHIVYVDVDAEFQHYPVLFDTFADRMKYDFGVYVFDRSCYRKSPKGLEVLSGTVFIKNTSGSFELLKKWEERCRSNPNEWDQKHLEYVLRGRFDPLPGEYCKIFDRMSEIKDPVIVHFQASREVRRNRGKLTG